MRRAGRLRPIASYRWSAAQRFAGPFGRAWTRHRRFASTAGDALGNDISGVDPSVPHDFLYN
jgi:hypothetical protein